MPFAPESDPDDWKAYDPASLVVYGDPWEPDVLFGPDGNVLKLLERPFGLARYAEERK